MAEVERVKSFDEMVELFSELLSKALILMK